MEVAWLLIGICLGAVIFFGGLYVGLNVKTKGAVLDSDFQKSRSSLDV